MSRYLPNPLVRIPLGLADRLADDLIWLLAGGKNDWAKAASSRAWTFTSGRPRTDAREVVREACERVTPCSKDSIRWRCGDEKVEIAAALVRAKKHLTFMFFALADQNFTNDEQAPSVPRIGGQINKWGDIDLYANPAALLRLSSGPDRELKEHLAGVIDHELTHRFDRWFEIEHKNRSSRSGDAAMSGMSMSLCFLPRKPKLFFTHGDLPHAEQPAEVRAFASQVAYIIRRWLVQGSVPEDERPQRIIEQAISSNPFLVFEYSRMTPDGQRKVFRDNATLIAKLREVRARQ